MFLQTVQKYTKLAVYFILVIVLRICTIFYRRPLLHFTVLPIKDVIKNRNDDAKLQHAVEKFRLGKQYEQKLVGIASTLSAGATIGIFSWPDVASTHWYARALWYSSLVLAIFSLIGSSQQRLLGATGCLEDTAASDEEQKEGLRVFINPDDDDLDLNGNRTISWYTSNMMFVWQWTLMLMVWSWVTFLMALMLHIIRPFLPIQEPATADRNVAIWFLAVLVPILLTYAWCAWWTGYVTRKHVHTAASNASLWHILVKILD